MVISSTRMSTYQPQQISQKQASRVNDGDADDVKGATSSAHVQNDHDADDQVSVATTAARRVSPTSAAALTALQEAG